MNPIKKISLSLFFMCICIIGCFGQNNIIDSNVYKSVRHNIMAYYIRFSGDARLGDKYPQFSKRKGFDFFDVYMGFELDILIEKVEGSDIFYPIKDYELYSVYQPGFSLNDPYSSAETRLITTSVKYYLLAINKLTREMKFLSGDLYRHKIAGDFLLDINHPATFDNFIKIKFFNLRVDSVKFIRSDNEYMYFKAKRKENNSSWEIKMNKSDFDDIQKVE